MKAAGRGFATLVSACLVVLAAAVPATAATTDYEGEVVGNDASLITFSVAKKNGVRKVKNVYVEYVLASCGGKPTYLYQDTVGAAKVKEGGKFKYRASGSGIVFVFDGKLSRGGTASGVLRLSGLYNVNGQQTLCDTGDQDWTASSV